MIIASQLNPIAVFGGLALIGLGIYIIGILMCRVLRDCEKELDEEPIHHWEEYTGADGKTYYWPSSHPRTSRENETEKTA